MRVRPQTSTQGVSRRRSPTHSAEAAALRPSAEPYRDGSDRQWASDQEALSQVYAKLIEPMPGRRVLDTFGDHRQIAGVCGAGDLVCEAPGLRIGCEPHDKVLVQLQAADGQ